MKNVNPTYLAFVLFLSLVFVGNVWGQENDEKDKYVFGVFPYLPPANIEKIYASIASDFANILHKPVQLRSRRNFESFRSQVEHEAYDIVYIQPFDYVRVAAINNTYIPIARFVALSDRNNSGVIKAQFVVRSDSKITDIMELEGQTIAMSSEGAAVTLMGKLYLQTYGLTGDRNVSLRYQGNHISCLQQVILGKAVACVTARPPLRMMELKTGKRFRVLAETPPIPSSLYAVHKRVPLAHYKLLKQEILSWTKTERGKQHLKNANIKMYIPTADSDYDVVRAMWQQLQDNQPPVH
jgi:phosphonate transport system substrate-binding protein